MQRALGYVSGVGAAVAAVTPHVVRLLVHPAVDRLAVDFGCAAAWIVCAFGLLTVGSFNNARKWWIVATAPLALFHAFKFVAMMAFWIFGGAR